MNGLSDVRLTLHSQQLQADHERATAPREINRWRLFWHRLKELV